MKPWKFVLLVLLILLLGYVVLDRERTLDSERAASQGVRSQIGQREASLQGAQGTEASSDTSQQETRREPPTLELRGTVRRLGVSAGASTESVNLRLTLPGGETRDARSPWGQFVLRVGHADRSAPGRLTAWAPGYSPVTVVVPPEQRTLTPIWLVRTASYQGQVASPDGAPMPGLRVSLGRHGRPSATAVVRTDALGRFNIPLAARSHSLAADLSFGSAQSHGWELYFSEPGRMWPAVPARVGGLVGEHRIELTQSGARLAIEVVDAGGVPALGALVWIVPPVEARTDIEAALEEGPDVARLGPDGLYRPELRPTQDMIVLAVQRSTGGLVHHYVVPVDRLEKGVPYRVSLAAPQRNLRLEVVDAEGRVVSNAAVHLRLPLPGILAGRTADLVGRTADDGGVSWQLVDSGQGKLEMPERPTMGRVAYRNPEGKHVVTEGEVRIRVGPRDSRSTLRLEENPPMGQERIWVAPPQVDVARLGEPVEIAFTWQHESGHRVGKTGSDLRRVRVGNDPSDTAWVVFGLKPVADADAQRMPRAWVRFANGMVHTYRFDRADWLRSFTHQAVIALHPRGVRDAELDVQLRASELAASTSAADVPMVLRATCLDLPPRIAGLSARSIVGNLGRSVRVAGVSAPSTWLLSARSIDGRWHGMLRVELRPGAQAATLELSEAQELAVRMELPDGSAPAGVVCLLKPKSAGLGAPVRCRYDDETGIATSPPILMAAYDLSAFVVVPTIQENGRTRHVRHVVTRPASSVHGGKVVLVPERTDGLRSPPPARRRDK